MFDVTHVSNDCRVDNVKSKPMPVIAHTGESCMGTRLLLVGDVANY